MARVLNVCLQDELPYLKAVVHNAKSPSHQHGGRWCTLFGVGFETSIASIKSALRKCATLAVVVQISLDLTSQPIGVNIINAYLSCNR